MLLVGANTETFEHCIDVFKEIGYTFDTSIGGEEESMVNMQLWKGKNTAYTVSLCLMLDIKDNTGASDYIKINYVSNEK